MIVLAAFLEVCECGERGRFVMADTSRSREFHCENDGEAELMRLRTESKVSDIEVGYLRDCLRRSSIPRDARYADPFAQLACALMNKLSDTLSEKAKEHHGQIH